MAKIRPLFGDRAGTPTSASRGLFAIAQQDSLREPVYGDSAAAAKYFQQVYNYTTFNFKGESTAIQSNTRNRSRFERKRQRGPAGSAGPFAMEVPREGMGVIIAQLMGTSKPEQVVATPVISAAGADNYLNAADITSETALGAITDPTTTTGPVRLRVTLSGSTAPAAGTATVTITGTDFEDNPISETVSFNLSALAAQYTTQFFKTLNTPTIGTATAGSLTITASDRTADHKKTTKFVQDSEGPQFSTFYIERGNVPQVIPGAYFDSMSATIQREGTIEANLQMRGNIPYVRRNIAGVGPDETTDITPRTDLSGFAPFPDDSAVGWQAGVFVDIDGTPTRIGAYNGTMTFDNQPNWSPVLSGRRDNVRLIEGTIDTNFSGSLSYNLEDEGLETDFLNNTTFDNIELRIVSTTIGGFPYVLSMKGAQGQIRSFPDPDVGAEEELQVPVELGFLPSTSTANDAMVITLEELSTYTYKDYTA